MLRDATAREPMKGQAPTLAELEQRVRTARADLEIQRRGRPVHGAEGAARHQLVVALECYVAALQDLHLPVPPRIGAELRLIRSLDRSR